MDEEDDFESGTGLPSDDERDGQIHDGPAVGDEFEDELDTPVIDPARSVASELISGASANMAVIGSLTLHFRDRDVVAMMDGYAALRMLTSIERNEEGWGDPLNPALSDAGNLWIAIRTERLLGASWVPGRPSTGGIAIDPEAA